MIKREDMRNFHIDMDRELLDYIKIYLHDEENILKLKFILSILLDNEFISDEQIINVCLELDHLLIPLYKSFSTGDFYKMVSDILDLLDVMVEEYIMMDEFEICENISKFIRVYSNIEYNKEDINNENKNNNDDYGY